MIKYYFQNSFVKGHELLFYIFLIIIFLMILSTIIIGYKEIKKHENK